MHSASSRSAIDERNGWQIAQYPTSPCVSYRRAAQLFRDATGGWTLHQLRHSRLTHLAEAGVQLPILMAKSRHLSLISLAVYAQPHLRRRRRRHRGTRRRVADAPATRWRFEASRRPVARCSPDEYGPQAGGRAPVTTEPEGAIKSATIFEGSGVLWSCCRQHRESCHAHCRQLRQLPSPRAQPDPEVQLTHNNDHNHDDVPLVAHRVQPHKACSFDRPSPSRVARGCRKQWRRFFNLVRCTYLCGFAVPYGCTQL
jgi:hypothetical protein